MSYSYERFLNEENKVYSWLPDQHGSGGSYVIFPDVISQLLIKADYSFKNKYLVSAGFLSERSKLFPTFDPASHSFPSIKAGWVLSNEKFLGVPSLINYLEIYTKYGQSRRNVHLYDYYDRGLLKDEILKENVIGMNLILLNKRVSFLFEHYCKITNDGIWVETVSFSNQIFEYNAMEIRNRGWEFSTRLNIIARKKFRWTSDFNLSINENKVLSDLITNSPVDMYGQSVGTIIGNRFAGFSSDNRMLVYDVAGNQVPYAEREYLENSIPKLYFGITNNFVFKNFDFTILLRGAAGNYIQNIYKYDLPHGGYNVKKNLTGADMRFLPYGETRLNMDYLLEKGSFIKADNVMLGYTINPQIWKIKKLRLFIACNNLVTFTKFSGWDPEMVPISGTYIGIYNVDLYPVTRIYSTGLKIEI